MRHLALSLVLFPAAMASAQDTCAVVIECESFSSSGEAGNFSSWESSMSRDGRRVVFSSGADNLVPGDTNGSADIFLRDIDLDITERVSLTSAGLQVSGSSSSATISPDGRMVAFLSDASQLVAGDTNQLTDVFVRDLTAGTTERVSLGAGGVQANAASKWIAISYDGRHVAFTSSASNLVSGDTNGRLDVFVHDRLTGVTTRVSVTSTGAQAALDSRKPAFARNGQLVFFESFSDLSSGASPQARQAYVHDRSTGMTECVSLSNSGEPAMHYVDDPRPSADGRYVVFRSRSANLTSDPPVWIRNVYVRDRLTNRTTLECRSVHATGNRNSYEASLSADGSTVLFSSSSNNLLPPDPRWRDQVYARSRDLGHLCGLSRAPSGAWGDQKSLSNSVSGDGSRAVFQSRAINLVSGTVSWWNVFSVDFRMGPGEVICGGDGRFGPCPCGRQGTRGEGCENSTRAGARLDVDGSADLVLDDLAFHASHLPTNEPAVLFSGLPGPVQPFSEGLLCLDGALTRIGVEQSNNHGEATWGEGMLSAAGAAFSVPVAFQAWYRDPASPCGGGSNLTQAVKILPAH